MDFNLSEEQKLVQETARDFARKTVLPRASEIEESKAVPKDLWLEMGRLGLLGVAIPKQYGGMEAGFLASAIVMEELSYASAGLTLSYGAHSFLCAHNLYSASSDGQRKKYLPKLCSGEWIGAFALTEPGSGSDAASLQTTAVLKGNEYILNGTKIFITNGSVADVIFLLARVRRGSGKTRLSAFIIEKGFPGFSVSKDIPKLGTRGSPLSELVFQDCRVPKENLAGEEGKGLSYMLNGLDMERAVFSGMPVGIAQAAFDYASRYALARRQFGQSISGFEMIQEMLAQTATEIEAARLLTYQAAWRLDQGLEVSKYASFAKLFGAQMVSRATQAAVQILGGYGFTKEFPVERYFRDAVLIGIGGGTSQIQQLIIAREILKEARLGLK